MIQQLLLLAQLLVLLLLYIFVWRVMRTATRDLRAPAAAPASADSTIIPAADVARARRAAGLAEPRVIVESSEVLREGVPFAIANGLTIGRVAGNDIVLDDSFVSSHHAKLQPPATLVDLDSTNGTLVNGHAVHGRTRLRTGDRIQIGSTVFRFEGPR